MVKASSAGRNTDRTLSTSLPALLDNGSDLRFREMIQAFFGLAARMTALRERIGAIGGLSGAQYSMLVSLGDLTRQGEKVSVNALAARLHVSGTYVTAESKKLEKMRLVRRDPNPADRRGVLLSLDESGLVLLDELLPSVKAINDVLFAGLSSSAFATLCAELPVLVEAADEALLVAQAEELRHCRR